LRCFIANLQGFFSGIFKFKGAQIRYSWLVARRPSFGRYDLVEQQPRSHYLCLAVSTILLLTALIKTREIDGHNFERGLSPIMARGTVRIFDHRARSRLYDHALLGAALQCVCTTTVMLNMGVHIWHSADAEICPYQIGHPNWEDEFSTRP